MKRTTKLGITGLLGLCLLASSVHADILELETSKMEVANRIVQDEIRQHGSSKTLIVFDVDHTLLTTYSDLGSSYWFSWQAQMIKTQEQEPEQLAKDMSELGKVTHDLFEKIPFRPTESPTQNIWNQLTKSKTDVMVITARSADLRVSTEREFAKNGLELPKRFPGKDIPGTWLYGTKKEQGSLSKEDLEKFGYTSPRPLSYSHGILMVEGQNKGLALKALLRRFNLEKKYKAIVLVDDSVSNCKAFKDVLGPTKLDVTTILYSSEEPRFEGFKDLQKFGAATEYRRLIQNP